MAEPQAEQTSPEPAEALQTAYDVGPTEYAPEEIEEQPTSSVAAAPEKPAAISHPDYLVEQAEELGISQAEIKATPTDQLGRLVRHLSRQALNEARNRPAPAQPAAAKPAEDEVDWGTGEDGKALTEADYLPAVAKQIKRAHTLEKKLAEQQAEIAKLNQRDQQREYEKAATQIDAGFADLPESLKGVFGEGRGDELEPTSRQLRRRNQVLEDLTKYPPKGGSLRSNVKRRAMELWSKDEDLEDETVTAPTPKRTAPAKDPATGRFTKEEWEEAALRRPTSRNGAAEPKGFEKAVKGVQRWQRENNLTGESELPEGAVPD